MNEPERVDDELKTNEDDNNNLTHSIDNNEDEIAVNDDDDDENQQEENETVNDNHDEKEIEHEDDHDNIVRESVNDSVTEELNNDHQSNNTMEHTMSAEEPPSENKTEVVVANSEIHAVQDSEEIEDNELVEANHDNEETREETEATEEQQGEEEEEEEGEEQQPAEDDYITEKDLRRSISKSSSRKTNNEVHESYEDEDKARFDDTEVQESIKSSEDEFMSPVRSVSRRSDSRDGRQSVDSLRTSSAHYVNIMDDHYSKRGEENIQNNNNNASIEDEIEIQNSLTLDWVFGINKDIVGGVHNLSDEFRREVFYVSGHIGVIFKTDKRQQILLQGHVHPITCTSVSADKRWIVTADAGVKNMVVVWDSLKGIPVKTIFEPHPIGIQAVDISHDSMYIATVSMMDENQHQVLSIWQWTSEDTAPIHSEIIPTYSIDSSNISPSTSSTPVPNANLDDKSAINSSPVQANSEEAAKKTTCTCIKFHFANSHLLLTNGPRIITFWNWDNEQLVYFNPSVTSRDFRQSVGEFTVSTFVPGTTMAATGTREGEIILWQQLDDTSGKQHEKKAFKVVKIHPNHSINFVTCIKNYIVTGGDDGHVKFLDHQLRLEAWFEEFVAGPIMSISFNRIVFSDEDSLIDFDRSDTGASFSSSSGLKFGGKNRIQNREEFSCPDFIISTNLAFVIKADAKAFNDYNIKSLRGDLVLLGQEGPIQALAAHPRMPYLVISGLSGHIHLWDYFNKKVIKITELTNLHVSCLAFDPKGEYLAVGCTNGVIKILDGTQIEELQHFRPSHAAILELKFSHDSLFIAVVDSDNCVGLFKWDHKDQNHQKNVEWVYIGRFKSHKKPIAGIEFGMVPFGDIPRLMSVGEDRRLIEYDLENSSIGEGIKLKSVHLVSQSAIPTAFLWTQESEVIERYRDEPSEFDYLIFTDNHFKFTQFLTPDSNRETRCLKTKISPTYGAPLNRILLVPNSRPDGNRDNPLKFSKPKLMAYATHERVVGLIHLPIDGDQSRAMGLIAHSGEISACVTSPDGKYLFTAGGSDCTVNQWKINSDCLTERKRNSESNLSPFIDQIEGGAEGEFFQEIKHMFYYAQIRSQGEVTTKERKITGEVPLEQIPNLMRAIGFYASNWQIYNIINELKLIMGESGPENSSTTPRRGSVSGNMNAVSGMLQKMDEIFIDFDTFVKIYVNHRPLFDIEAKDIEQSFTNLGAEPMTGVIRRDQLIEKLNTMGERISEQELLSCLSTLKDEQVYISSIDNRLTAQSFAQWLGFEYADELEQNEPSPRSNDPHHNGYDDVNSHHMNHDDYEDSDYDE
jgi:WD40 repeat protein